MKLVDAATATASGTGSVSGTGPGAATSPAPAASAADLIPELTSDAQHAGTAGRRRWWRVTCCDVGNRQRHLTVIADRGNVVLVGPPGETAVLTAGQLDQLRATLRQAAAQAGR